MHFILANVKDYAKRKQDMRNIQFEAGRFLYSLGFENEEKTRGFINWTPKDFPYLTSNVVSFTEKDGVFLLETSAKSNFNEFKRIIEHLAPYAEVERYKPSVKKERLEEVFREHLQQVEEHEKGWYIKSTLLFEEQMVHLEYSALTGKGETSMVLDATRQERMFEKLLDLFLVKI